MNKAERALLRALSERRGELFKIDLGKPFVITGDVCIVGDIHIPCTDLKWWGRVLEVAAKVLPRPRQLVIAGDYFNFEAFSLYDQVIEPPPWSQERDAAQHLMLEALAVFDQVHMVMGNHDRRIQRFTAAALETKDILSLIRADERRVRLSGFGYCTVRSGGQSFRVTHPKNYSINSLTVAEKIANKFHTHVISHHEHHLAMGWDRSGSYLLVNNGCLVDPAKLAYVLLDDNTSPVMMPGFCILKNGAPRLYGPEPWTDWSEWDERGDRQPAGGAKSGRRK